MLAFLLLSLVLTGCGGAGGGAPDLTPPSVSAVAIAPQTLPFPGGGVEVTAQINDDRDLPASLSVQAELVLIASGQSATGPVALSSSGPGAFSGVLTAPPNQSLTGTAQNYFARVTARDSSANQSAVEGGTLTVQAMELPPPPP